MRKNAVCRAGLFGAAALSLALLTPAALADDMPDIGTGEEAAQQQPDAADSGSQDTGEVAADVQDVNQTDTGAPSSEQAQATDGLVAAQQEFDQAQLQLQQIGSELEQTQGLIHSTQTDLKRIGSQIAQTKADIEQTTEDLGTAQAALAAYLQITYKSGVLSFLDVILASSDFNDFVTRTYYASAVQDSQVETINEIKELKVKLEKLQDDLTEQQATESDLLAQLREQEAQLSEQKQASDELVAQLSEQVQQLFAAQQQQLSAAASARALAAGAAQAGEQAGVYNVGISQGSITENAYACLGMPYVWGGDDSNYSTMLGYDCSGFAQHCYALEGYSIGRTTWDQIDEIQAAGNWKTSIEELEPGDLVFPTDGHVGVYIGNGQMIDAPSPGLFVRIDTITNFIGGGSPI